MPSFLSVLIFINIVGCRRPLFWYLIPSARKPC
jgi:hypothetical protein